MQIVVTNLFKNNDLRTILMRKLILLAAAAITAPSVAAACPTATVSAAQLTLSEAQLADPYTINTGAGGTISLANCGYAGGYVTAAPQVSITFTDTRGPVQISTYSSCDTVLLARTPDGHWWYNDDTGESLLSWLMADVTPGRMDVWVGTFNGNQCDAHLTLN